MPPRLAAPMTVVAWDGSTLAADKRCSDGSMIRTVTKVFRVGNLLVAGAGTRSMIMQMVEWVRAGRVVADFPPMQRDKDDWQPILVIEADGTPSQYDRTPYPSRFEDRCCAIGSGRDFAMAAMHLGYSAEKAVEVACALDSGCGNGVDVLPWIRPDNAWSPHEREEASDSRWKVELRRRMENWR